MRREKRPGTYTGAPCKLGHHARSSRSNVRPALTYEQWVGTWRKDCRVQLEDRAQHALAMLHDDQLASLRWVGLLDEGFQRMYDEPDRSGVQW